MHPEFSAMAFETTGYMRIDKVYTCIRLETILRVLYVFTPLVMTEINATLDRCPFSVNSLHPAPVETDRLHSGIAKDYRVIKPATAQNKRQYVFAIFEVERTCEEAL